MIKNTISKVFKGFYYGNSSDFIKKVCFLNNNNQTYWKQIV